MLNEESEKDVVVAMVYMDNSFFSSAENLVMVYEIVLGV